MFIANGSRQLAINKPPLYSLYALRTQLCRSWPCLRRLRYIAGMASSYRNH